MHCCNGGRRYALRHADARSRVALAENSLSVSRLPQTGGIVTRALAPHEVSDVHRREVPRRRRVKDNFFHLVTNVDYLFLHSDLEATAPRGQWSVAHLL